MIVGKLVVNNKNVQVQFTNAKGKSVSFNIKESELSTSLMELKRKAIALLHDLEVELEEVGGQPKQIREKGTLFQSSQSNQQRQSVGGKRIIPNPSKTTTETSQMGDFHNPYNFIPALLRHEVTGELGDRSPSGHGSYIDNHWSGKISVTLTTVTPLLIPDAANATGTDHKTYSIRKDADGKPYLPSTSIKGMLRSAYEAVTNSRLSIFKGHEEQLVYRMEAKEIGLIPARVEKNKNGTLKLHLMRAVKLPRYSIPPLTYDNSAVQSSLSNKPKLRSKLSSQMPQHGDSVWVKYNAKKVVTDIQKRDIDYLNPPDNDWEEGWVWVVNQNIKGKKYERVFIESKDYEDIQIDDNIKTIWQEIIQNYKKEHVKGLEKRDKDGVAYDVYVGHEPGQPAFSRHIYELDSETLKEGILCYVELDNDNKVKALLPVTLSRHFYDESPEDVLHDSLKPSKSMSELSPADRVFGWVNQDGNGSYKGQLGIHSVKCESDDAIKDDFGNDGLSLAILGQPKPEQSRFYAASSDRGEPLEIGCEKSEGYQKDGGLRGRKVYPHHQLPNPQAYWNPTQAVARVGDRHYKEYIRVDDTRDTQNRSIKAWVKPEKKFSFEIDVINLSDEELGALLWLLKSEPDYFHRLGGSKPLGFGSIRLEVKDTDLRTGVEWQVFYNSLLATQKPDQDSAIKTVEAFEKAVKSAYGSEFKKVSFIAAFLKSAQGFSNPIHYPRTTQAPDANVESFKWFVDNESQPKGMKLSLQSLEEDNGFPLQPKRP